MSATERYQARKVPFSDEEDETIIHLVSAREFLWNMQHEEFKNIQKKEQAWDEIASTMLRTRKECQSRWRSLRDHFKRVKRQSNPLARKRANYWNLLTFLEDPEELKNRVAANITNENLDSIVNDIQQETENEISKPPKTKKQRIMKVEEDHDIDFVYEIQEQHLPPNVTMNDPLKVDEQEDIDLFFKSIALTVKKFKPQLITKTKLKVLEIISDMEEIQYKSKC